MSKIITQWAWLGLLGACWAIHTPAFGQSTPKTFADYYEEGTSFLKENPDTAYRYAQRILERARLAKDAHWTMYGEYLLGKALYTQGKPAEALPYLLRVEQSATRLQDKKMLADVWIERGFFYKNVTKQLDSAAYRFQKAQQLAKAILHYAAYIHATNALSYLQMDKGRHKEALDMLLEVRKITEKFGSTEEKSNNLNNIGHIYLTIGAPSESIRFFQRAYQVAEQARLIAAMLLSKNNQALAYLQMGQYEDVLNALQVSERIVARYPKTPSRHLHRQILAKTYLKRERFTKAKDIFEELIASESLRDKSSQYACMVGVAQCYIGLGDTLTAHQTALKADMHARRYRYSFPPEVLVEGAEVLSITYKFLKEYDRALEKQLERHRLYVKLHNRYTHNDIYTNELKQRIRIQEEKAELEQILLGEQLLLKQKTAYLLWVVVLSLTVLLLGLSYTAVQKIRTNRLLAGKNEEIKEKNARLKEQNSEVQAINENLERIVEHRTQDLTQKNELLEEYAFINAHQLRAPVARLLGLCAVFQLAETEEEKADIVGKIKEETQDLDKIVCAIGDAIEHQVPLDRWDLENRKKTM